LKEAEDTVLILKKSNKMFSKINEHFFPGNPDVKQAFLYLHGEITTEKCGEIIGAILELNQDELYEDEDGDICVEDKVDVINLLISSSGGDMVAAFSTINIMRGSCIPIRCIALGEAASAALCLLMAGHQRVVTPFTSLLSHQFSTGVDGPLHVIKNAVREFECYFEKMLDLYQQCTGLELEYIKTELLSNHDHFFTIQDALRYNIVDLISDLR